MSFSKRVLVVVAVTVLMSSPSFACFNFNLCEIFKRKCRGHHPIVAAPVAITGTAVELLQEIVKQPEEMARVLGPSILHKPHSHHRRGR